MYVDIHDVNIIKVSDIPDAESGGGGAVARSDS